MIAQTMVNFATTVVLVIAAMVVLVMAAMVVLVMTATVTPVVTPVLIGMTVVLVMSMLVFGVMVGITSAALTVSPGIGCTYEHDCHDADYPFCGCRLLHHLPPLLLSSVF